MDLPRDSNIIWGISFLLSGMAALVFALRKFNLRQQRTQQKMDFQSRMDRLDEVIRLDPSNAIALWDKGEIHEALGNHEQALRLYRTAHMMCPKAYSSGDYKDAYQRLSGISPHVNSKSRIQSVSRS